MNTLYFLPIGHTGKTHTFIRPLDHIRRRKIETCMELSHSDKPTYFQRNSNGDVSSYRSQFQEYGEENQEYMKHLKACRNRPHPTKVCHLRSVVPEAKVICNVLSEQENLSLPPMQLETWNKITYKPFTLEDMSGVKRKTKPSQKAATGIVPVTKDLINQELKDGVMIQDPWLPATLGVTTAVAANKPYQFLPRRKKVITCSLSSAGVRGAKIPDENRFYHDIRPRRGKLPSQITVRVK